MAIAFLVPIPLMPGLPALSSGPSVSLLLRTPWAVINFINFLLPTSILQKLCAFQSLPFI